MTTEGKNNDLMNKKSIKKSNSIKLWIATAFNAAPNHVDLFCSRPKLWGDYTQCYVGTPVSYLVSRDLMKCLLRNTAICLPKHGSREIVEIEFTIKPRKGAGRELERR